MRREGVLGTKGSVDYEDVRIRGTPSRLCLGVAFVVQNKCLILISKNRSLMGVSNRAFQKCFVMPCMRLPIMLAPMLMPVRSSMPCIPVSVITPCCQFP